MEYLCAYPGYNDTVALSFYSLKPTPRLVKDIEFHRNATTSITINSKKGTLVYDPKDSNKLLGIDKTILYLNAIESNDYLFTIRFPQSSPDMQRVKSVKAYATVINVGYSQFALAIRYVFLILTIASTVFYIFRLRKIDRSNWVIEQKMVIGLSIITILFNDPFYAATITNPNHANNLFSVMWVVNLAVYLVLFWITILDVD